MKTTKTIAANDPGHCPVRAAKMAKIFDRLQECMEYLSCRWADEKEYEDIAQYQKYIETELATIDATDVAITKMIRRPFGFECNFMGAKYRITCGARSSEYRRIG